MPIDNGPRSHNQRLWIWHAHFSVVGSKNDIDVLDTSHLFIDQCNGNGSTIEFTANGRWHHMGYDLADDIHSRWLFF